MFDDSTQLKKSRLPLILVLVAVVAGVAALLLLR